MPYTQGIVQDSPISSCHLLTLTIIKPVPVTARAQAYSLA